MSRNEFAKRAAKLMGFAAAVAAVVPQQAQGQLPPPGNCDRCNTYFSIFCDGGVCHEHSDTGEGYRMTNAQNHDGGAYPYGCEDEHDICPDSEEVIEIAKALDTAVHGGKDVSTIISALKGGTAVFRPELRRVDLMVWCTRIGANVSIKVPVRPDRMEAVRLAFQERRHGLAGAPNQ